jgi:hypothetical protein
MDNPWVEFYIFNPFEEVKENAQDEYNNSYNKCYDILLQSLMIPSPADLLSSDDSTKTMEFIFYIDCNGELDIINPDWYEFKFLKSYFMDKKRREIYKLLCNYYNIYDINVRKIIKQDKNYYIFLEK